MSFLYAIPSPTVSSFQLGPVVIHFYALFILAGIIVAVALTAARMKARGMEAGLAIDIAIWAVPLGIIGGRAFHVLTHLSDYFGPGRDWTAISDCGKVDLQSMAQSSSALLAHTLLVR